MMNISTQIRKYLCLTVCLIALKDNGWSQSAARNFEIHVLFPKNSKVQDLILFHLSSSGSGGYQEDTIPVNNAYAKIEGKLVGPNRAMIYFRTSARGRLVRADFFLVDGKTEIIFNENFSDYKITGPEAVQKFETIERDQKKYKTQIDKLIDQQVMYELGNDLAKVKLMERKTDSLNILMIKDTYLEFVKKDQKSALSFFALNQLPFKFFSDDIALLINKFPLSIKNSPEFLQYKTKFENYAKLKKGKPAPVFKMRAVDGTSISVTNFRGKYLLVDFWASWCIPCREENKKLIRIYPQFPRKDFEILSVALEKEGQSQKWKKAIADDKMVWPQVTDFKYWRSPVVGLYAIQGIPYNVLLDKNGLIIAHDIHGDELTQLLQTLIKK